MHKNFLLHKMIATLKTYPCISTVRSGHPTDLACDVTLKRTVPLSVVLVMRFSFNILIEF